MQRTEKILLTRSPSPGSHDLSRQSWTLTRGLVWYPSLPLGTKLLKPPLVSFIIFEIFLNLTIFEKIKLIRWQIAIELSNKTVQSKF